MARKKNPRPDENQIPLIETAHPASKRYKTAKNAYLRLIEDKNKAALAADKKREELLAIIRDDFKARPDADGVTRFVLDGELQKVTPGKSKLSFSSAPTDPDPEDVENEDNAQEGESNDD